MSSLFPVFCKSRHTVTMSGNQKIAILSVYDKTGLLDLAKGLIQQNVRILASGGTSRMIRDAGMPVEYETPRRRSSLNI